MATKNNYIGPDEPAATGTELQSAKEAFAQQIANANTVGNVVPFKPTPSKLSPSDVSTDDRAILHQAVKEALEYIPLDKATECGDALSGFGCDDEGAKAIFIDWYTGKSEGKRDSANEIWEDGSEDWGNIQKLFALARVGATIDTAIDHKSPCAFSNHIQKGDKQQLLASASITKFAVLKRWMRHEYNQVVEHVASERLGKDDFIAAINREFERRYPDHSETPDLFARNPTDALDYINNRHIYIRSFGGSPAITNLIYNEVAGRDIMEFISTKSFTEVYSNEYVKTPGGDRAQIGRWWISHKDRNEVKGVIFDPSKPQQWNGYLNLWEGFSVEPQKGNWHRTQKHIYRILCNGDRASFKYVLKWFAWLVQKPDLIPEVAIFFKGKQGSGKGFIFKQFLKIFGKHGMAISSSEQLTGNFTGHFANLVFLFADEAVAPNDYASEGKLKQLITEPEIALRAMRRDAVAAKNRLHIGAATNNDWVLQANDNSRRYFITTVNNRYAKGESSDVVRVRYFEKLWGEMENGGVEAMLYDLLKMDLGNWHPRNDVPDTEELQEQKQLSLKGNERAVFALLNDGVFPGTLIRERNITKPVEYVVKSEVLKDYLDKIEPGSGKIWQRVTNVLKRIGVTKDIRGGGYVHWVFPEIDICRNNWEKEFGRTKWEITKVPLKNTKGETVIEYVDGHPEPKCIDLAEWQVLTTPF